ncbi:tRNA 2-thiouridine(34) synthase MnmA [Candidatus Zinderia endosymbiont of Aphrophora alni]|uniref:tRNA 2-thiouridine(34) synthase MnmA n=1 Tax=Candidatus Zinderia endosymbiont of Aphrophora alni TaxID=3077951 RepID=UPI0030CFCF10
MKKKKIILGMSGGIDSSVSAWILKEQGYEVIGLFMNNWNDNKKKNNFCNNKKDLIDAISIADIIGINIKIVNFSKEYKKYIFSNFIKEYKKGNTPNPDITCNSIIKFNFFLNYANSILKTNLIATGHYARIKKTLKGKYKLLKAKDLNKDQSYFLYRLNQKQLSKSIFPIGNFYKTKIKEIAKKLKFPNVNKKNSTGICFIGKRPFRKFLNNYINYNPGPIKTTSGITISKHIGLSFYTIGQRKGIGIGGIKKNIYIKKKNTPWYVAKKNIKKNILYVVQGHNHPWLLSYKIIIYKTHWISGKAPKNFSILKAKIRYRQKDSKCIIYYYNKLYILYFIEPQWGAAKGQSIVLYNKNICLGGGIIK